MKGKISRRHFLKKSTALPAQKFGFNKRGVLKEGIEYVVVNGQVVINQGEHTGNLPGRILRKQVTT